jgi:hypothetical protein
LSPSLSSDSASAAASSSRTKRRQRTTEDLLHWRRSQVAKLLATGHTIDQTAEELQVSPKTVQRDHSYIRHHAYEVLRNYFVDTVPNEMLKALARLTAVSDATWTMAARARENGNDKLEADALRLAKDTARDIKDIVTNNKPLIDAAWEVAYKQDGNDELGQTNKNLNASQEGDKKKEVEPVV